MVAVLGGAVNPSDPRRRERVRNIFLHTERMSLYNYAKKTMLTGLVRESIPGGIPLAGGSYRALTQIYFKGGTPTKYNVILTHVASGGRIDLARESPMLRAAVLYRILYGIDWTNFYVYRGLEPSPGLSPITPELYALLARINERRRELGIGGASTRRVDGRRPGRSG